MKHNLFSRFIGVLLAVVMLASLMSMPSLANTVSGEDLAVTDVQTTDTVDGTGEETTDEAGSDPAALSVEGEEDKTTAGEENGEPDAEEGAASENEAASSSEEGTGSEENTASSDVDTSSAEETAPAAVQLTAEAKNEAGAVVANVTVEADEGVIPEGAALVADLLTGNDAEAAGNDLDEAGVEYDGYMALDIHLEDADGNEVEPNGEVRVIMVAPAALPEDADPTTVAVQHHEEQDNGEVKVEEVASAANTDATPATLSADTASSEQPATGVAAENTDVTAAFGVEKFSTFTITWGTPEDGEKVTVYYVATNGSQIVNERNDVTVSTNSEIDLEERYGNQITGYQYQCAYLDYGPAEINKDENPYYQFKAADRIRYKDGKLQYGRDSGYQVVWTDWELPEGLEEYRVFLVYAVTSYSPGKEVDTLDTSKDITINLFDYEQSEINNNHALQFKTYTISNYIEPNSWTSNSGGKEGGALQGIVQNKLVGGYPVLKENSSWPGWNPLEWVEGQLKAQSLDYLFNGQKVSGKTQTIMGANHLFQMDADGYYYYDSAKNIAVLNKDRNGNYTSNFTVYSNTSGKFNPFYTASNNAELNNHFGMTIETSFVMPENGQINGRNMVFEFTGDDDVWVFIDDVLVLDIGGIHGAVTGSIDFSGENGTVKIDQVNNGWKSSSEPYERTLADLFEAEGETWNNDTYSSHTLKFFYLERGGNASNCKIRFNIPVIPKASLVVSKDLAATESGTLQSYLEDTMTYRFRVVNATSHDSYFEKNFEYDILEDGKKAGTGKVGDDGIFTLKAGQAAVFPEAFEDNSNPYYVQELLPLNASGQYEGIAYTYEGTQSATTQTDQNGVVVGGTTYAGYMTETISPVAGQTANVSYTNTVNTENMATLQITKELQEGDTGNSEDVFQMQVKVNGELIAKETTYTVGSETKTVTTEGIIELKAGETATIPMLADSSYEVQEVNLNTDLYKLVSYQKNTEEPVTAVETAISGTIAEPGQEEKITVTNGVNEPEDDKDFDGKPDYQKKAVDDNGDGVYDLSLSVKGSASSSTNKSPINVLFVVDQSSSMDSNKRGQVKSAVETLMEQLKGYNAKYALVNFGGTYGHGEKPYDDANITQSWTDNQELIKNGLKGNDYNYGSYTNYEAGIKTAISALSDPGMNVGADTVIIFISDGNPTAHYYDNGGTNWNGSGTGEIKAEDINAAKEAIGNLPSTVDYFYTVGVGSNVDDYEYLDQLLQSKPESVQGKHFNGTNQDTMNGAFQQIAEEVTYKAFSNVTINDTLSDYVDVQTDQNDNPTSFYIEVIPSSGTTIQSNEVTNNQDGTYTATLTLAKTDMNGSEADIDRTLTATYNSNNGTIVLDFPNDYKLENQWTYEVHIDILPNDKAEAAYINAGYEYPTTEITTGDLASLKPNAPAGTADNGTGTHSGKTGFYSNKTATITYTAENNRYIGNYKKPVVQLKTVPVTIEKTFAGLVTGDDAVNPPAGFVINVGNKELAWDTAADNQEKQSWTLNLPVGEYDLTETNFSYAANDDANKELDTVTVAGTETPTTIDNVEGTSIVLGKLKVEGTENSKKVSITNAYKDFVGTLQIIKEIEGDPLGDGKDVFIFKIQNEDTPENVWYMQANGKGYATYYDAEGLETELTLPAGKYTVMELDNINYDASKTQYKVDGAVSYMDGTSATVNVDGDGAVVTFKNSPRDDGRFTDGSGVINVFSSDEGTINFEQKPIESHPVENGDSNGSEAQ